ncbi:MAG: class I SAM-dependent methyltransferase [Planctomycetota bacterium]
MVKALKKNAKSPKTESKSRAKAKYTAKTADKHLLYQLSVQSTEQEVEILEETFEERRDRKAMSLKEDFCGTSLLACEWIKSDPKRTAAGLDIDRSTLDWGIKHNVSGLGDAASRLTLLEQDVLEPTKSKFDICVGMNFSYFLFKKRNQLKAYFEAAYKSLNKDGVFFLDCYGGWESQQVMEEKRKQKGFDYIWDQADFNPIDNSVTNHIHFRFKDGSKMDKAFTYVWRLWTPAEVVELLEEVGFKEIDVLWEDEDDDGEGIGTHSAVIDVENQPGWLCYIVGEK